ncbi:MAG: lysine--tRNA ligase, partial [Bacteroidia bacterium]|nr:lysine--tRNA ligase [Bacteroidia bacterium]
MTHQLNEQELVRRENLQKMIDMGINPYPSETYDISNTIKEILEGHNEGSEEFQNVRIAGRLMSRRIMGKASFAEIQDSTGRIQIYVSRDDICPGENKDMYNQVFKKLVDLGDFIGIEGYAFFTKTGQLSVHVTKLVMLSKSLKPLPVVKTDAEGIAHDVVTDPEFKYRQRYVDLNVNPEVRETFIQRSKMINAMRQFMVDRGYLEVETPILQPMYGGAAARPFTTHHNTLDTTFYLRIANELYLKRLIVGGYDGVFE